MNSVSVYNDVLFQINKAGGYLSASEYNGLSKRAELHFLDIISGKITGEIPQPYTTQKARDWLSPFIASYPAQVVKGRITRPGDYYAWENAFLLGDYYKTPDCTSDEDEDDQNDGTVVSDCNIPIELLSNDEFYNRCNTYIEGLQPSFTKPICKMIGKEIEFAPKDMGSITLEYVRYPVFGEIKMKFDPEYNEEIPDPATSIDYEWGEYTREYFISVMVDLFSNSTREQALKTFNAASKP